MEPAISLAPLPGFELIADLSVNTGKWMHGMSERLEAWFTLGCHDVCPKNLPLSTQIAFLRRKMAAVGWK